MSLPQLIAEDVQELDRLLGELVSRSEASSAMVIDKGGFLITQSGTLPDVDVVTLAALAAGSYAATQGMANVVSEPNFNCVYQQGENFSLMVQNIESDTLLVVVFPVHISVGAVKYFANASVPHLDRLFAAARGRGTGQLDLSMLNLENSSEFFRKVAAG